MRILITGITGFVGQNLKKYLDHLGYGDVRGLDLRSDWKVQLHSDPMAIIHLAGKAHDLKKVSDPEEYYKINFHLTKALYLEFLSSTAKIFIFVSSVKAAADVVEGKLTENILPNPETDYGKSKLLAENYIQSTPLPIGKSYIILRPCMIHGPGNKGNLNLLYQFVRKGLPYPLAAFNNRRSYLSVQNLCFVIDKVLKTGNLESGIYHLADDQSLSTVEVFNLLSRSLNREARLWRVPVKLVRLAAQIGDKLRLPFNTERLEKLTENFEVSNEKIKSVLKVELPVNSSEGILLTAASFEKPQL